MNRNTDSDWEKIGDTEPWYGVLATEKFLRANLTPAAIEEFYAQGSSEIEYIMMTIQRHFGEFKPRSAVDFGCGLGRLAFAMAKHSSHVIGIDISPGMLAEAEEQRARRGLLNVSFTTDIQTIEKTDWINSYIVFQHIAPRHGFALLENLLSRLNEHGVISIQLTYFHDQRDMASLNRDAAAYFYDGESMKIYATPHSEPGQMSMFDYDLNNIFRLLYSYGIQQTLVHQTDHGGCHGLWLFGVKEPT
jgi:tRNA/tmRNA/rRNA uracil-C5-methylase (TrmA/RlmC/RlmD family)